MTLNPTEMRTFMEAINSEKEPIDEAGGVIDKTMAAFGGKKAKGRVETEKERKHIEDGWKEYQGAQGVDEHDPEAFKDFLTYWNFSEPEIEQIMTMPFNPKDSLLRAARIQHRSGKGVTGPERGGPFVQEHPGGDDFESIISFYQKGLGGNIRQLQLELAAIKKPDQISNDPLAMLGFAYLTANGKTKKR